MFSYEMPSKTASALREQPSRAPAMPERLAASAIALFSTRGIGNVSVDDVAAKAGVTKGSLYWHYTSKDDLIKAACDHYYRLYHRRINAELAHIAGAAERLARAIEVAVRICLLDRENRVFTTEIFTLAVHNKELSRSWRQFSDSVREFYIGLLRAAVVAGELKSPDPEQAVDFMLSAMEGLKLRAQHEPHLCSRQSERSIVANLKRSVGFADSLR
jgi:AcrR family transcriptional regulator